MNKLWAPWRINYIVQKKTKDCLFCRIQKESSDKKNLIVYRSKFCFVVINAFPYNNGHIMVVPNRHIGSMEDLSDTQMLDLNKTMKTMLPILKKTLKPDGFNIGLNLGRAAGAGIDKHLHMHIVPRWFGDTNFMPVTAATKIISQSLDQLHDLLRKNIHPVRDAKNNLNTGN